MPDALGKTIQRPLGAIIAKITSNAALLTLGVVILLLTAQSFGVDDVWPIIFFACFGLVVSSVQSCYESSQSRRIAINETDRLYEHEEKLLIDKRMVRRKRRPKRLPMRQ